MTSPSASPWTDVMVSDLRRLWARGDTCAQIGQLIGLTKNSVISKAHRIGLPARKEKPPAPSAAAIEEKRKARVERQRRNRQDKRGFTIGERTPPMTIIELPVHSEARSIPFGDLRQWSENSSNECRFIAAEPAGPDYVACGKPTAPGESWCATCKGVVFNYQPTATALARARDRAA
ncbi:GcrA family cell cycle regulator [Bradyrhizobium sp. 18]|uniref:GcrA family cell cycle regulator n=1 Tax=Bradyrhizobium sp. 18 TaxID=2782657 RepID=UPI001FF79527|nr:GcrA family cell cycle regulator [Bradyrhizobium sp. 18]MCK1503883.1 hypothetical protein [Bradyrhizobium sp. 18]